MMAANLNFDLGVMVLVGAAVAVPAATAGLIFAYIANRLHRAMLGEALRLVDAGVCDYDDIDTAARLTIPREVASCPRCNQCCCSPDPAGGVAPTPTRLR